MTDFHDLLLRRKIVRERSGTGAGQSVRPTPILRRHSFDEAQSLESGKCLVQSPGSKFDSSKLSDVLNECVPVLLTARQTRKYESRHTGILAQVI